MFETNEYIYMIGMLYAWLGLAVDCKSDTRQGRA